MVLGGIYVGVFTSNKVTKIYRNHSMPKNDLNFGNGCKVAGFTTRLLPIDRIAWY